LIVQLAHAEKGRVRERERKGKRLSWQTIKEYSFEKRRKWRQRDRERKRKREDRQ